VGLRVRLGYATADELVEGLAGSVAEGGLFLRTREPKPPGTEVAFQLCLASGKSAFRGRGVVQPAAEGSPAGTYVAITALDAPSRALFDRMLVARGKRSAPGAPVVTAAPAPKPSKSGGGTGTPTIAKATKGPAQADLTLPHAVQRLEVGPVAVDLGLCKGATPDRPPSRTIIGIDLGTTNSCAAIVRDGKPYVIPSRLGHNTVPSIVGINARHQVVVGHQARSQLLSHPKDTVYGAKRLLGRPFRSKAVQEIREVFSYEVVEGQDGLAAVELARQRLSLEEVSALILKEVREVAQNHIGEEVTRAVITVPAYYTERQREAVRRAGAMAGIHVERIVNEPTAAAIAYAYGRSLHQRVLVYDLGGGTFDASVLELQDNVYEVISTGGDTFLGGVDFDQRIAERLLELYREQTGIPFDGDRVALSRLFDAAERTKCALSEQREHRIDLPFLAMKNGTPVNFSTALTRDEVVPLVEPLVARTIGVCQEVLSMKGLTPQDLDEVIMVGGQSRMPLVRERIQAFFGKPPSRSVHPDEAVAIGAALLASSLGSSNGVVLIDVLPISIGIALPNGRVRTVFERNTPLPSRKQYGLSTTEDGQTEFELVVVQGDAPATDDCEYLGTVRLDGLPAGPRGMLKIAVAFELGAECLLTVTARELATSKSVRTSFAVHTPSSPQGPRSLEGLVTTTHSLPVALAPPNGSARHCSKETAHPAKARRLRRWRGFWNRLFGRRARSCP